MPKFAPNTGFKMPGVGSKEIDSPSNFRDEHHVDKMGYCDNTPDDMLPEGSSPLKARYTSSGYLKDLDAITIPVSKKSESKPKPADEPAPPPPPEKKGKGFVFVPNTPKTDIKKPDPISVSGKTPGKTSYSGGGTLKNQAEKDFYDKEVKRLGGVQQYRDYYKIGKKTTTPSSSSSISSNPK
jgi:hypothetical protein